MAPFWKKKQDKQRDSVETRSEKVPSPTKEEILEKLTSGEFTTLNEMLKKNSEVIREKKEIPSLGHALDLIQKDLLERLDSHSKVAYTKGYFHMYPLFLAGAGDLDKLGIIELDVKGNGDYQNYALPGKLLFAELSYPDQAKDLYAHAPGHFSKDQMVNAFGQPSMEPTLRKVVPRLIVQATYKNLLYLILEFETEAKAHEFMLGTEINWRFFFVTRLGIKEFSPYLKRNNGLLQLDLPMSIMPPNFQKFPLTETNRIWWSNGKTVFSANCAGKETESEKSERQYRLETLILISQANKNYFKST